MSPIPSSLTVPVSFARTPLAEISRKVSEIEACGWEASDRADAWLVAFRKDISEGEADKAKTELREIMGDYWLPVAR